MALESDEPIDLLINSPGGSVYAGMAVVDAIKFAQERGVEVRCVSGVMAASMGFIILSECSQRYALPNARLLFHPISISVRGARVNEIVPDLVETLREEEDIKRKLCSRLNFKRGFFDKHYYAETFWQAANLAKRSPRFVNIVDDVKGFGEDLFKYRSQAMFFMITGQAADILERYEQGGLGNGTPE
jgi:ATP-dependent Clp protease protease subunit